jgi:cysteine desulfurase
VIRAINTDPNRIAVRFSFSRHNTREEIDQVVGLVKTFI